MNGLEAAREFVEKYFPDSSVAMLGGSVVRGEKTKTSDLDIFILIKDLESPYRESFTEYGWPIEAFIHNLDSYKCFFASDVKRRRPSLPKICSEGIVIKDRENLAELIKNEAEEILSKGPNPFDEIELKNERYAITDMLDDLIGADNYEQEIFIVNELNEKLCNFILVNNGKWMARGKWIPKVIKEMDYRLYDELMNCLFMFYQYKDKRRFVKFTARQLDNYGGRLFEGYSIGKK